MYRCKAFERMIQRKVECRLFLLPCILSVALNTLSAEISDKKNQEKKKKKLNGIFFACGAKAAFERATNSSSHSVCFIHHPVDRVGRTRNT